MSRLLPTSSDASTERSGPPSLLSIDDAQATDVLDALSSETAREIFRELNARPLTAARLADRFDMSIQSITYHLENLSAAGLIEVADTCYSEKGREMDVYTVSEERLLIYLGTDEDRTGLRAAFRRLSVRIGPSALLLVIWERITRLVGWGMDDA
jgi:DNA-binding transcriptional ArsR family regulator